MTRHILDVTVPADWDRRGLPGWSYHSPAFLELEKEHVFRTHWQIVGHISDVPEPGNYLTMDVVGRKSADRARPGWRRAWLSQHLPASRQPRRGLRERHLQERSGLPLPRLGL